MDKQKTGGEKREASNASELEELAERVKETAVIRKTRRVRSETRV